MDTGLQNLSALFEQLGLKNDEINMKIFLATHHLPKGVSISEASFWTASQAEFLRECLNQDAEWAESVDLLATMMSTKIL